MKTKWETRPYPQGLSEDDAQEIAEECGVSPLTAEILVKRGCSNPEEAMAYLEPEWDDLLDPFGLPDMAVAVKRLLAARDAQETLCVYGDYDADGTTAVSILMMYLKKIGIKAFYEIPNRLKEGYGMNIPALTRVIEKGATLILTVDNGIAAHEQVAFCNEKGVDVIITDHHECQGVLPKALAVIDPKREDSQYPFGELCGAGIAFKVVSALDMALDLNEDLSEYLECAALATVADIVPLKSENRIITHLGIRSMNEGPRNVGIAALKKVSEVEAVNAGNIGFIMAPKINAAGRLGEAGRVVDLYCAKKPEDAMAVACFLRDENKKRQDIEEEILKTATGVVQDQNKYRNDFVVVWGEEWHSGVIGIVASKLQEKWYHPTIVMGIDEKGVARGSCRSVPGVDIFLALSSCAHLFLSYGGHEQAAGFSIECGKIEELEEGLAAWAAQNHVADHLAKTVYYDGLLKPEEADFDLLDELAQCEPYGIGNPGPVFKMAVPQAAGIKRMGKDKNHLSFAIDDLRCVAFSQGDAYDAVAAGDFSLLCKLKYHQFNGTESVQPLVVDVKGSPLKDNKRAWEMVETIKKGSEAQIKDLEIWDLPREALVPDREKYVTIYKILGKTQGKGVPFDQVLKAVPSLDSFQLLVSLNVLQEADLITFKLARGILFSKKCKTNEKKDIQNTSLVIKLNKYLDFSKRED